MRAFPTFMEAFIDNIQSIVNQPDFNTGSRTGRQFEQIGMSYVVTDPTTFKFENEEVGRIPYSYASDFYDWMISGCGEEATEVFKKKYSHAAAFLEKPKSKHLPDNFNVFYGPRIVRQLPAIIKELTVNKTSRRAVINILNEDDQLLLDADETLEYPCADSATILIRPDYDGKDRLYLHLHMRSNNMANVAKLDMYLWGRFQCWLASEFGIEPGYFSSSIVSAHVFEKDIPYLTKLGVI